MKKYKVLKVNQDFIMKTTSVSNPKGSRTKRDIKQLKSFGKYIEISNRNIGRMGYFKYSKYTGCSEECSEKLAYEISRVLKLKAAQVEFAQDEKGIIGIISFLFMKHGQSHTDAKEFFNVEDEDRKKTYTIPKIKKFLDTYGENLFADFIGIMVFDALIGETDRHEENWGLLKENNTYTLSPIYDCGCNLLREYKEPDKLNEFENGKKDFESYIKKSKTYIYKEENQSQFKHFELIEYLYKNYKQNTQAHIVNLKKLSDKEINKIISKLPNGIINEKHAEYISKYIKIRRDILLKMLE